MSEYFKSAIIKEPGLVEFQDVPFVEPGPDEILIKVKAAAICGSDLHLFKGRHPSAGLPSAVGHELAGCIVQVGSSVDDFKPGGRVTVEPVIICDSCRACLSGQYNLCSNISFQYRQGRSGFADYFLAPARWVHHLPDSVSYEEGALTEPLAVAAHAIKNAGPIIGKTAAVFGDGAIGLLILMLLKHDGANPIYLTGVQDARLKLAEKLGADKAINNLKQDSADIIRELSAGEGVDLSFEAVGLGQTLNQALDVLRKGGRSVLLGIFEETSMEFNPNIFIQKEISLTGSQGYCRDFPTALNMLEQEGPGPAEIISHRLPMHELQKAFEILLKPDSGAVKIVMFND